MGGSFKNLGRCLPLPLCRAQSTAFEFHDPAVCPGRSLLAHPHCRLVFRQMIRRRVAKTLVSASATHANSRLGSRHCCGGAQPVVAGTSGAIVTISRRGHCLLHHLNSSSHATSLRSDTVKDHLIMIAMEKSFESRRGKAARFPRRRWWWVAHPLGGAQLTPQHHPLPKTRQPLIPPQP